MPDATSEAAPAALDAARRDVLRAYCARDAALRVVGAAALALHLGRPLPARVVARSPRAHRVRGAPSAWLSVRRRAEPEPARSPRALPVREGIRCGALDEAWLEALDGGEHAVPPNWHGAAARALEPGGAARIALEAGRRGCTPSLARAAYFLAVVRGAPIVARPAEPVLLYPEGPRRGETDPATRVRVNGAPGVSLPASAVDALAGAVMAGASAGVCEALRLARVGVTLDAALLVLCEEEAAEPSVSARPRAVPLGARARRGAGAARLAVLVAGGVLEPTEDGARYTLVAPLDAASWPLPQPDTLQRARGVLAVSAEPARRLEALTLDVALASPPDVPRVLALAVAALERGDTVTVARWRSLAEPHAPRLARALHLRILENHGRLREALALARAAVREAGAPDASRAAALLDRARLAWRVGQPREATAALRALRRAARGPEGAALRLEASLLRATIALERGAITRSRVALAAARGMAEESGDDEALARVLRRLGTLEARTGRPAAAAGAYRAALAALARVTQPLDAGLAPLLTANLATMESWLGRVDVARALYEDALAQRRDRPLEALNTRAALALLEASRGVRPAEGAFGPLLREAERLGDPRLRAELASYRVEELVFEGRLTQAEGVLGAARAALADLGGAELILDAMVDVTEGLLRARRGERGAAARLASAVDRLASGDARYHAARAARLAATALVWLGEDAGAIGWIARCAALGEAGGFALGDALPHVVALALAALRGRAARRRTRSRRSTGSAQSASRPRSAARAAPTSRALGPRSDSRCRPARCSVRSVPRARARSPPSSATR